jgi:Family of unknown function (DUF5990)
VNGSKEIRVRVILTAPPPGVLFGLQEGTGSNYKTVQLQRSGLTDLRFEIAITQRPLKETSSTPDFSGPYVHGPKDGRFIYIDIGTAAGDYASEWTRRLKIPLKDISADMVDKLSRSNGVLQVTVPGRAKDGGPNCATVKPFPGWEIVTG